MIRLDEKRLKEELKTARKWRDQHLGAWKEMTSRVSGPAVLEGGGMDRASNDQENFAV